MSIYFSPYCRNAPAVLDLVSGSKQLSDMMVKAAKDVLENAPILLAAECVGIGTPDSVKATLVLCRADISAESASERITLCKSLFIEDKTLLDDYIKGHAGDVVRQCGVAPLLAAKGLLEGQRLKEFVEQMELYIDPGDTTFFVDMGCLEMRQFKGNASDVATAMRAVCPDITLHAAAVSKCQSYFDNYSAMRVLGEHPDGTRFSELDGHGPFNRDLQETILNRLGLDPSLPPQFFASSERRELFFSLFLKLSLPVSQNLFVSCLESSLQDIQEDSHELDMALELVAWLRCDSAKEKFGVLMKTSLPKLDTETRRMFLSSAGVQRVLGEDFSSLVKLCVKENPDLIVLLNNTAISDKPFYTPLVADVVKQHEFSDEALRQIATGLDFRGINWGAFGNPFPRDILAYGVESFDRSDVGFLHSLVPEEMQESVSQELLVTELGLDSNFVTINEHCMVICHDLSGDLSSPITVDELLNHTVVLFKPDGQVKKLSLLDIVISDQDTPGLPRCIQQIVKEAREHLGDIVSPLRDDVVSYVVAHYRDLRGIIGFAKHLALSDQIVVINNILEAGHRSTVFQLCLDSIGLVCISDVVVSHIRRNPESWTDSDLASISKSLYTPTKLELYELYKESLGRPEGPLSDAFVLPFATNILPNHVGVLADIFMHPKFTERQKLYDGFTRCRPMFGNVLRTKLSASLESGETNMDAYFFILKRVGFRGVSMRDGVQRYTELFTRCPELIDSVSKPERCMHSESGLAPLIAFLRAHPVPSAFTWRVVESVINRMPLDNVIVDLALAPHSELIPYVGFIEDLLREAIGKPSVLLADVIGHFDLALIMGEYFEKQKQPSLLGELIRSFLFRQLELNRIDPVQRQVAMSDLMFSSKPANSCHSEFDTILDVVSAVRPTSIDSNRLIDYVLEVIESKDISRITTLISTVVSRQNVTFQSGVLRRVVKRVEFTSELQNSVVEGLDVPACLNVELDSEDRVTKERAAYIAMSRTRLFHEGTLPAAIMWRLAVMPEEAQVRDLLPEFSLLFESQANTQAKTNAMDVSVLDLVAPSMLGVRTYQDTDAELLYSALPDQLKTVYSAHDVSELMNLDTAYYASVMNDCLVLVRKSSTEGADHPNINCLSDLKLYRFMPDGRLTLIDPNQQLVGSADFKLLPQFVRHSLAQARDLSRYLPFVRKSLDVFMSIAKKTPSLCDDGLGTFFITTVRAALQAKYEDVCVEETKAAARKKIVALNDAMNKIELSTYTDQLQSIWDELDKDDKLKMVYMLGRLSSWGILGLHHNGLNIANNTMYRSCYMFLDQYMTEYPEDSNVMGGLGYGQVQRRVLPSVKDELRKGGCIEQAMLLLSCNFPHVKSITLNQTSAPAPSLA